MATIIKGSHLEWVEKVVKRLIPAATGVELYRRRGEDSVSGLVWRVAFRVDDVLYTGASAYVSGAVLTAQDNYLRAKAVSKEQDRAYESSELARKSAERLVRRRGLSGFIEVHAATVMRYGRCGVVINEKGRGNYYRGGGGTVAEALTEALRARVNAYVPSRA